MSGCGLSLPIRTEQTIDAQALDLPDGELRVSAEYSQMSSLGQSCLDRGSLQCDQFAGHRHPTSRPRPARFHDMMRRESWPLLDRIQTHRIQPEFVTRLHWMCRKTGLLGQPLSKLPRSE